jgi:farnesyl diphosphate synthase
MTNTPFGFFSEDVFDDWVKRQLQLIEHRLDLLLPAAEKLPKTLHEGMRYAVLDGGKRIRPLLTLAAAELASVVCIAENAMRGDAALTGLFLASATSQEAVAHDQALSAGCALEMVHAYSLVHDDLPCMDNDVLRRGKPTVHVAFGEANAMLVGDSLQPLAFQTLAAIKGLSADNKVALVQLLGTASGSLGMAGGQAIDLAMVGRLDIDQPQLEQMHRLKTGALLEAAALMGAWCSPISPSALLIDTLKVYSRSIGLAFQVVDDILDVSADTATLGKTAGKDAMADKPTFVSLMGLEAAKKFAASLEKQALQALEPYKTTHGESAVNRLEQLAALIVKRKS